MALLLRPTSVSIPRLIAGLVFSTSFVAAGHWLLHPMDPFCVLSIGCGAFAYVLVVGNSHSVIWYLLAAPLTMLAILVVPGWPAYQASLERGLVGQTQMRRRRDTSGF